jgi:hypothetical protein
MARNYLKRFVGDEINALMAASAFNFRRWMRKVKLLPDFLSWRVAQYLPGIIRTQLIGLKWSFAFATDYRLRKFY